MASVPKFTLVEGVKKKMKVNVTKSKKITQSKYSMQNSFPTKLVYQGKICHECDQIGNIYYIFYT